MVIIVWHLVWAYVKDELLTITHYYTFYCCQEFLALVVNLVELTQQYLTHGLWYLTDNLVSTLQYLIPSWCMDRNQTSSHWRASWPVWRLAQWRRADTLTNWALRLPGSSGHCPTCPSCRPRCWCSQFATRRSKSHSLCILLVTFNKGNNLAVA